MSFEQPDNPFFLSFTHVLRCVLGASVALFLIFVVTVKLVPGMQGAAEDGAVGMSGIERAIEREKLRGLLPAVLQIVGQCNWMRTIEVEPRLPTTTLWKFDNGQGECGTLIEFEKGFPQSRTSIIAEEAPSQPVHVTLSVGATTWPKVVSIDETRFRGGKKDRRVGTLMILNGRARPIILFATTAQPVSQFGDKEP